MLPVSREGQQRQDLKRKTKIEVAKERSGFKASFLFLFFFLAIVLAS